MQTRKLGGTLDTAEVYGPYTNEELVGEALAPLPPRAHQEKRRRLAAALRTDVIDLAARTRVLSPLPALPRS